MTQKVHTQTKHNSEQHRHRTAKHKGRKTTTETQGVERVTRRWGGGHDRRGERGREEAWRGSFENGFSKDFVTSHRTDTWDGESRSWLRGRTEGRNSHDIHWHLKTVYLLIMVTYVGPLFLKLILTYFLSWFEPI